MGKHNKINEWDSGEEKIQNCDKYKYLGDIITSDGKNKLVAYAKKCESQ